MIVPVIVGCSDILIFAYKYSRIFHFREETEKAPKCQRSGQTWKLGGKKLRILNIGINWMYFNRRIQAPATVYSFNGCQSPKIVWVRRLFFDDLRQWELLTYSQDLLSLEFYIIILFSNMYKYFPIPDNRVLPTTVRVRAYSVLRWVNSVLDALCIWIDNPLHCNH